MKRITVKQTSVCTFKYQKVLLVFSHGAAAGMLAHCDVSAFCHSHLKAYERENANRTIALCHSVNSSQSDFLSALSCLFSPPLTRNRCLMIKSQIKFIVQVGLSRSFTDNKALRC